MCCKVLLSRTWNRYLQTTEYHLIVLGQEETELTWCQELLIASSATGTVTSAQIVKKTCHTPTVEGRAACMRIWLVKIEHSQWKVKNCLFRRVKVSLVYIVIGIDRKSTMTSTSPSGCGSICV